MAVDLILKLVALSLAKKVSVFVIAKTYGFPRLYRKMMRVNRKVFKNDESTRRSVMEWTQYTFRLPRILMEKWKGKKTLENVGSGSVRNSAAGSASAPASTSASASASASTAANKTGSSSSSPPPPSSSTLKYSTTLSQKPTLSSSISSRLSATGKASERMMHQASAKLKVVRSNGLRKTMNKFKSSLSLIPQAEHVNETVLLKTVPARSAVSGLAAVLERPVDSAAQGVVHRAL
mmetsp:Transcript_17896/g.31106  ORF Transcript_17896/g.31106 Transcript_17896/m.31106 type:complete len:235 (+) Transcript_17896:320-1024(+)